MGTRPAAARAGRLCRLRRTHTCTARLAVTAVALLGLFSNASALYTSKDDVVELTGANFDRFVEEAPGAAIVSCRCSTTYACLATGCVRGVAALS
jgi:hypothetical protein